MIRIRNKFAGFILFVILPFAVFAGGCAHPQRTFATPELAVDALVQSLRSNDQASLRDILGSQGEAVISSGDPVADEHGIGVFLSAYDEKHQLVNKEDGYVTLQVGKSDWPMPIPVVKGENANTWRFDTAAGKDELLNRRIGRNELDAMQVCLAIVDAQREFAMRDPDGDGIPAYAQKFLSDAGKKNGLYWATNEGEEPSPLGSLVAEAEEQGYSAYRRAGKPVPYRGYLYRILKSQGRNAPGGARDFMVGKEMLGGFAIVASPAEYGVSGIMTFIVNQDGVVYERDLGRTTEMKALTMKVFDPTPEWTKVDPPAPTATTQP